MLGEASIPFKLRKVYITELFRDSFIFGLRHMRKRRKRKAGGGEEQAGHAPGFKPESCFSKVPRLPHLGQRQKQLCPVLNGGTIMKRVPPHPTSLTSQAWELILVATACSSEWCLRGVRTHGRERGHTGGFPCVLECPVFWECVSGHPRKGVAGLIPPLSGTALVTIPSIMH